MSRLVKLEKRFEDAFEKLEFAISNRYKGKVPDSNNGKEELIKKSPDNIQDLLIKIQILEKAVASDAKEIDKLIVKLKEILETEHD